MLVHTESPQIQENLSTFAVRLIITVVKEIASDYEEVKRETRNIVEARLVAHDCRDRNPVLVR